MAHLDARLIRPEDRYVLTPRGEAELRGGRTTLPLAALELLVRINGQTSAAELQTGMSSTSFEEITRTLAFLLGDKYIRQADASTSDALRFDAVPGLAGMLSSQACAAVQPEATAGLKALEQYGYYVRIARRPEAKPTLPTDRRAQAVVVEDEPHLAKFLKHFLMFEGFDVRVGVDRESIVQALRAQPLPDLVLLDIMLPDTNGLDVLAAIRRHPMLHAVPVMMLTAESTRQSVINGLAAGADGYITKPFQTDILLNAIRTIFGLTHSPEDAPWGYS